MKKLITYIALIICIYANAQADKVNEISKAKLEVENEWRETVDKQLKQLQAMSVAMYKLQNDINNLKSKVESQSDLITQLTLKSWRDSLRLEQMSKRLEYTQSFIKDSVYFALADVDPIDTNLLADVSNSHKAWTYNEDGSYSYDHNIANYQYLVFNLKENLKPNSTYTISFTIQLEDTSREALINFWFYDDEGNTRLSDTYYGEGNHSFEYTVNSFEKIKLGIRARNNDGGTFTISNIKIEAQ
jgi:hypothetical protein